ncbi:MAG: diguanylate cyclase [Sideroxyarcus sp.]|nr:diguanylate cyclase [Sideroxyarcus sp.]
MDLLKQIGVAALYVSLLYIGESHFESGGAVVGYFEPASGLALAALLIGGKRYAWSILLGAFLAHATTDDSLWEAVAVASADTLQALCGVWLLTRSGRFDLRLQSLRDYLQLILLGGCVGIAAGALAANTTLLVFGLLAPANYSHSLVQWWMGDTLGVILIAPLILAWLGAGKNWRTAGIMAETALIIGLAILACQAIFLGWWPDNAGIDAKGYWMFLIVTWVAIRIGACGTTVVLAMTATYALLGAIHGVGYFAHDIAKAHLVNYWLYTVILSVVGMALATHFTERKKAELALRQYKVVIDTVNDGFWITDAMGNMLVANAAYAKMSGYSVDELVNMHVSQLEAIEQSMEEMRVHIEKVIARGHERFETSHRHKDGHEIDVEVSATFMPELQQFFVFIHDITKRKRAEQEVHTLAFYDALTGLPNRRLLNDRVKTAIAAGKRSGRYGAVMFLDLDNFKPLNDAYGHDVGDLLLVEAAQRLTRCVRGADTVARFGGDEFVVVLGELDSDRAKSSEQADIVAEKIRTALGEPYVLKCEQEGQAPAMVEHRCTSSIGVTLFVNHAAHPEEILKHADMAMYQAKEAGRNRIHFHQG